MKELSCAHQSCRCTISSTSPDPYCCEYCGEHASEKHASEKQRCACGHDACGGMPGVDVDPAARIPAELDPALGRKA